MEKDLVQWHPMFVLALKEYLKNYSDIDIISEYNLSKKPLQIDVLMKLYDEEIDNEIGKFFRSYNIIEYKSPDDSFNIDDYYKVLAYAYLYKSLREDDKLIEIDEMTISIFGSKKPKKLLKYLEEVEKLNITMESEGIYYIYGLTIPIQIINLSELQIVEEEYALMLFSNKDDKLKKATAHVISKEDIRKKEELLQIVYSKKQELFWEVVNNMSNNEEKMKQEEILFMIKKNFDPEIAKKVFIDEKDKEEIKEEIKEETKKQELIKMSIQLLTKKFGVLPKEIKDKIEKSDYSDLEVIMGEIFEFKDLDDVRKYLQ